GLAPATVRTQLRRGLELLRRRLPASVALPAGTVFLAEPAFAALRRSVLAAAGPAGAALTVSSLPLALPLAAASLSGPLLLGLAMKKLLILVALTVALGVTIVWSVFSADSPRAGAGGPAVPVGMGVAEQEG